MRSISGSGLWYGIARKRFRLIRSTPDGVVNLDADATGLDFLSCFGVDVDADVALAAVAFGCAEGFETCVAGDFLLSTFPSAATGEDVLFAAGVVAGFFTAVARGVATFGFVGAVDNVFADFSSSCFCGDGFVAVVETVGATTAEGFETVVATFSFDTVLLLWTTGTGFGGVGTFAGAFATVLDGGTAFALIFAMGALVAATPAPDPTTGFAALIGLQFLRGVCFVRGDT